MKKISVIILWIIFVIVIPSLYLILKKFIKQNLYAEILIVYAPYLLSVITIMFRADINVYLFLKRIYLFFFGIDTVWLFSVRYTNIINQNNLINKLEDVFARQNCKIIKKENTFMNVLWDNTNMLNFRIENPSFSQFDLHFYTSKIDVPYRSINKKITLLSRLIEIIENSIDMVDRNSKQYEIQIVYTENNPYYSYWTKTIPREKIRSLNCKIYDDEKSIINVSINSIHFLETSMPGLFNKIKNYLSLRGL